MTYKEKLRDPRWQQKRLRVMERDGWTCKVCGDKSTTLNVHHKRYQKGAEPWEYGDEKLMTICEACHHSLRLIDDNQANAADTIYTAFQLFSMRLMDGHLGAAALSYNDARKKWLKAQDDGASVEETDALCAAMSDAGWAMIEEANAVFSKDLLEFGGVRSKYNPAFLAVCVKMGIL